LFKKYPPTSTNVTLYGASPETYGKICGSLEGFNQTLRGLDMLSEVSTVLEVRSTFIKDNMYELDELRRIANKYTERFAININVNKAIRGADSDVENCRLNPAQVYDIVDANLQYYTTLNTDAGDDMLKNMETDHFTEVRDYGFDLPPKIIECLASKSMYWITWDGKMLPCGSFSSPYTLPFEEGFKPAWDRLPALFESIMPPHECTICEYGNGKCPNCPAILQTESGFPDKVSPYICEMTKERTLRSKERYKQY
jgi:MoaA/NifB/PqqE/SkfB family radical SAM enzyme